MTFRLIYVCCLSLPRNRWCSESPSVKLCLNVSFYWSILASLVAQKVKRMPAMQETRVRSLGRKDPLQEGMATQSRILAWRIPRTEEPGGVTESRTRLSN